MSVKDHKISRKYFIQKLFHLPKLFDIKASQDAIVLHEKTLEIKQEICFFYKNHKVQVRMYSK